MEPEEIRRARVNLQRLLQDVELIDARYQSPASSALVTSARQCVINLAAVAGAGEVDLAALMKPQAVKVIAALPAVSKPVTK